MRRSTWPDNAGPEQEAAVRHVSRWTLFLLLIAIPGPPGSPAQEGSHPAEVSLYAAASLREALEDLAPTCESSLGVSLVFNFGASNDLAWQIITAARADVFFSA